MFLNQAATQAGIINTLNRLHIAGFQYSSTLGSGGAHRYNCDSPGKLSFADGDCVDWGNPLAETYLEALRYFAVDGAGDVVNKPGVPSSVFDTSDASKLSTIPQVDWVDPIPDNQWCAISNIVVMSTGLNSFDTDQLASFTPRKGSTSVIDANTLTHTVGDSSHEAINGGAYLIGNLIGGSTTTANNQCTAKASVDLDKVKGICPEVPSTEGGYGIAGLAYAPKTIDLRPDYATQRTARWGGTNPINPDWAARQPLDTYTVQLGDTLPSFSVSVGSGTVTILPSCQANATGNTAAWTAATSANWRNCSMTNLVINDNVANMGDVGTTLAKTCSGNGSTSRCFTVAWEDSTWGNDYDMDGIQRLGFCLGSACSTFKMLCPTTASATATIGPFSALSTQVVVATCAIQANAGHALSFGYTLTGTTSSGAFYPILRPGSQNFNVGSVLPSNTITAPNNATFNASASASANLLKSPLWYAAKYGGFLESTPTAGTPAPNLQSEWDLKNNFTGAAGPDGEPDNYFNVRNPSTLITALSNVFDKATQRSGDAASVATNSTNLRAESRIYQAKFSSVDWSGQLQSFLFSGGVLNTTTPEWDAGTIINTQHWSTGRTILTKGATQGIPFRFTNLSGPTATVGSQQDLLDRNAAGNKDNCGSERVNYLRGDNTNEGTPTSSFACGGTTITKFRTRNTSKLGDIVNSNPLYIAAPSAGFSDSEHPGYSAFFTSQLRRTPIVYAGSNDGMLHGFDASLTFPTGNLVGIPSPTAGKEVLAYIPSAVIGNLSKLTDQSYNKNHLYFVDGSPMAGDVDLGTANWATMLVGAMGGGGKGYYALNITNPPATNPLNTNPTTFSETGTDPQKTVMWEFGRNDDIDVGFAFNFPPVSGATNQAKQIVKMANGKWAVIVGNGYNSTNGKAVLYVLFFADGLDGTLSASEFVKIVADTGTNNGLSTPVPYDSDGDGFVDTVYAGDLKGKLWKFLVGPNASDTSVTSTTSTWKVAFSGTPLFSATDSGGTVQPIIAPPEVTAHPNGGQMVMFGTGKYIETSDITSTA